MESENSTSPRRAFKERLAQVSEVGRAAGKIAAEEAMTWDLFRWTVVVLLSLILIFILLVYNAGPQEVASDQNASEIASLRTELSEQLAQAKAELAADVVATQFGLRQPPSQTEPEPTGSIDAPTIPVPARSPHRQ